MCHWRGVYGSYSTIRLSELGKTVIVVEERSQLGSHTGTHTDSTIGSHFDIGVTVQHDLPIVKDYLSQLNISLAKSRTADPRTSVYFDFSTGRPVPGYIPTDPTPGLIGYAAQLAKYPYLEEGFGGILYPVPHDLLLPFGQFAKSYNSNPFWNFYSHCSWLRQFAYTTNPLRFQELWPGYPQRHAD